MYMTLIKTICESEAPAEKMLSNIVNKQTTNKISNKGENCLLNFAISALQANEEASENRQ